MLVLIDESGCPGFKLSKGSSPFFVVGMVVFDDLKEAENTSATIAQARIDLRVKPEFKFSKCHDDARDGFFAAIAPHGFRIRALVVDKAKIYSKFLRTSTDDFYRYFVQMMMRHDGGALTGASVKIDGSGSREFKRSLGAYLRREIGPGKIAKLKFVDSRGDNLVQLADMAMGAIARSYNGRANANRWRNMLAGKIENVWEFE